MATSNSKPEDDFASRISAALSGNHNPAAATVTGTAHPEPDYPAESFRLPLEAELEWLDRSVAAAAIYERDDSTKGTSNPKAQHLHHSHQQPQQHQHHGSNRFSGPLKPRKSAILGLPKPVGRHSGYIGGGTRKGKASATARIFPRKKGRGKAAVEEPGSPKVSCFGKVRSERERCREERRRMRREAEQIRMQEEEEEEGKGRTDSDAAAGRYRRGFWSCLLLGPWACCRGNPVVSSAEEDTDRRTSSTSSSEKKTNKNRDRYKKKNKDHRTTSVDGFSNPFNLADRDDQSSPRSSSAADPPRLGGLKRFASGRRPSSWGGGEFEGIGESVQVSAGVHADASGPLAPGRKSVG